MPSLFFSLTVAVAQWKAVFATTPPDGWYAVSLTQQPFYNNVAFQTKQCIQNHEETIYYNSWVIDDVILC